MNAAAVLGGGLWLGSLHSKANRNSEDIKELAAKKADIDSIKELHSNTAQISEIKVQVARVEEQMKHQTIKLDEIHSALARR